VRVIRFTTPTKDCSAPSCCAIAASQPSHLRSERAFTSAASRQSCQERREIVVREREWKRNERFPPVHELAKRGVVGNLVGFSTFYSAENPPSSIIDAVASGKIDIAIVWGPAAGYYVKQQRVPLVMVPIPSGKGDLPFEFGMSMGVKLGNDALRLKLEKVIDSRHAEIIKILNDYNVPLVERKAGAKR